MRIPLFVWSIEAYAVLLPLVLPAISAAVTMLLLDRQGVSSFFEGDNGPLLWQHMFWFFGHPEVYIMVLPAMGMLSEVIPVFSPKPIFGYKAIFSTSASPSRACSSGRTTCSPIGMAERSSGGSWLPR